MPASQIDSPSTRISLLMRIRHPDNQDAWTLFIETYTPLVTRYCHRWGLQEADAQDVSQTVFGIVVRSIAGFEYDRSRGRFRNWLGTITCREIRRQQTKAARLGRGTGNDCQVMMLESSEFESDWTDEFNARIYECAIDRIQPSFEQETWRAFELTWLEGHKPSAASTALGKPVAWISRAKYRVLRRLKEEIEFLASDVAVLAGRGNPRH